MDGFGISLILFLLFRQLFRTTHKRSPLFTIMIVFVLLGSYGDIVRHVLPSHSSIFVDGFVAGLKVRVPFEDVQQWAIDRLVDYREGTLETLAEDAFWPLTKELDPRNIPEDVQNMWREPPSVGIVDNPRIGDPCIAISWDYLRAGILIGKLDFQSQWKPSQFREIHPGMYVYRE